MPFKIHGRVMDDLDIYRSAKLYVDQCGADASIHAAIKQDATLERGDLDGVAVWRRIIRAIEELQATEGETEH